MTQTRMKMISVVLMVALIVTMTAIFVQYTASESNVAYAAATSTLSYKVYDFEEYQGYLKKVDFFNAYILYRKLAIQGYDASDLELAWKATGGDSDDIFINGVSAYAYFGNKMPGELSDYSTIKSGIDSLNTAKQCNNAKPSTYISMPGEKNSFSAGEYMMVQVYAQSATGIRGGELYFDVAGSLNLTNASNWSDSVLPTDDDSYVYCWMNDAKQSDGMNPLFNELSSGGLPTKAMPSLRFANNPKITDSLYVGYIAFKIKSGASSGSFGCYQRNTTTFITVEPSAPSTITETTSPITVSAGTSGTAQVSATGVTINGSVPTTGTTATVDSAALDIFKGTTQTTSTSSVAIHIVPDYAGTVQSMKYYVGTTCPSTKTGFNQTAAGSLNDFTITPSTWNTGDTVFALAEIRSYDGTATTYYVLQAAKDKHDVKQLTALTISGGSGSSVCTLTTAFSPTTYTYTINVSKDTTVINVTPTVASGYSETIKVDGASATSGTATPVTVSTTKTSIVVRVTSQKGNNQDYTLNLNWLSDDVSISALNASVYHSSGTASSNISKFTYTAASHEYALSGSTNVPYGSTYYTFTITPTAGSSATVEYSTDGGSTYSTSNPGNVVFATGTGADTKTVHVRITAPDGVTKQVYSIKVTRYGGDTDSSLSAASYKTKQGASYGSDSPITFISDAATISGLAYKKSAVQIKVTPTATSVTRIDYSYTVDGVAGTPGSLLRNSYSSDLEFSTSHKNASTIVVTIRVYAQDQDYHTDYTITFGRVAASTDKSYSAFAAYNNVSAPVTGSWSSTTWTASPLLEYTVSGVKINVTFNALASATAQDNAATPTVYNLTSGSTSGLFSYSLTTQENKEITLTITAEDGSSQAYTIKVYRKAADDTATYSITVKDSTGTSTYSLTATPASFDTTTHAQTQTVTTMIPYSETSCIVNIVPTVSTTTVKYGGAAVSMPYTLPISQTNYLQYDKTEAFTLTTQAGNTYTINLKYTRAAGDTDTTLTASPDVVGVSSGTHYAADSTSSGNTYNYTYVCSAEGGATTYFLGISPNKPTSTKIYATTSIPTSATDSILNSTSLYSGTAGSRSFNVGTILYITLVPQVASQYRVYTINVAAKDERETEAGINNITITGLASGTSFTFVATTLNYGPFTVPYSTTSLSYTVTMKSAKEGLAKCGLNGSSSAGAVGVSKEYNGTINLVSGTTNDLIIQACAENTSVVGSIYTIQITRSIGNTDNFLTSLAINSNNVTIPTSGTLIDYCVVRSVSSAQIDFTVSTNAHYELTNVDNGAVITNSLSYTRSLAVSTANTVTIKVVSEQDYVDFGASAPSTLYTIKIYRAEQFYNVSDIELYNNSAATTPLVTKEGYTFVPSSKTYTLTGTYSNMPGVIAVVQKGADSPNAVVSGDITYTNLTAGVQKTLTIKIKSEYASLNPNITNQEETYTFKFTRDAASTDNTLADLWVMVDGTKVIITQPNAFTPGDTGTYLVGNLTGASIVLGYTLNDPTHATVDTTSNLSTTLSATNTTEQLTVKVLDELGNPNTYTVKVSSTNLVLDTNNTITSINVNSDGSTNLITYSQTVPSYLVTPNLRYSVQTVNVSATLASATAKLFINSNEVASGVAIPVTIDRVTKVTKIKVQAKAENGTLGTEYEIELRTEAPDTDKTLKKFTIDGNAVTNGAVIKVVNTTTDIDLEAEVNSIYSTIAPHDTGFPRQYTLTNSSINVGSNTFSFTVTAEDLSTLVYSVTVIRDDINTLDDLRVFDSADTAKTNNLITNFAAGSPYNFTVPYTVSSVEIEYDLAAGANPANLTVTGAGTKALTAGTLNTFNVKVVAASGATETYTINITRTAGSADNNITKYEAEDGTDIPFTGTIITYVLDRSYATGGYFNPNYTISTNATSAIIETNKSFVVGLNQFTIEVTSQTGVKKTYIIKVYVADQDNEITNIELLNPGVSPMTPYIDTASNSLTYSVSNLVYGPFAAAYATSSLYLRITPKSANSVIYVNGSPYTNTTITLAGGTNTYSIYAKSEYGTYNTSATGVDSPTYTITINRDTPNSDARLKSLTAKINGINKIAMFDPDTDTYTITDIGNDVSSILIEAEAMVAYPKAVVENGTSRNNATNTGIVSYTKSLAGVTTDTTTGVTTGYNFEHIITVTAEDGTTKTYTLNISRGAINLNDDNTILYIEVKDSTGATYLTNASFNASTLVYNITIPYGPQSYSIVANVYAGSPITIFGDGQFQINFAPGNLDASGNYYKSHTVYARSQSGINGTEYTINVRVAKPSADASLADLQVNWNTVAGFTPTTLNYTIATVTNNIDSIHISATAADPTATVSGHLGYVSLAEGNNTFVVTVTAQSGSQQNYQINIKRQYATPTLLDLEVVGEQLLNTQDKAVTFDPDTLTYHVIVKYVTDSITIDGIVEDATYTVSCSNSTIVSSSGSIREFKSNALDVGVNEFTIGVRSTHGMSTNYKLIVQRRDKDSANTNIATLTITAIETNEKLMAEGEYNSLQSEYTYVVPNKVRNLDLKLTVEKIKDALGDGAKYQIFNDKNLSVGENKVIILVTAEDGETTRVVIVNVERKPNGFDVSISGQNNTILEGEKSLSTFREDFANDTIKAYYEVSTAVNSLDFTVLNRDTTDMAQPEYQVINGSNLKIGDNNVRLLIKAADGTVSAQDIVVRRLPMSFTVNKKAYEYSCEEAQGTTANNYVIDLKSKTVDAIEDYTKYIEFDKAQNLTTEVISKSNSEVVVKVATADSAEVQYVHFLINTTANNGTVFDIIFWIILGIAIILLVIILIFVNKDKYGSVSNSRKK